MNYNEALEYIHGTRKLGWKLGLDNIRYLLDLMGNPQKKLKFIHVAGTNGKGSIVAFSSSILIEAGYKVGTFTSPYLERFTERIRINNMDIPDQELGRITGIVKEKIQEMIRGGKVHPTEFEIITAIAMKYFHEQGCDLVVLEVGLGGRFDSTNVIDTPVLSVITTISYDHMDFLGNTLEEIAFEKAGIIKESGDVVLYPQLDNIQSYFRNICRDRKAILHETDFYDLVLSSYSENGQKFSYGGNEYFEIKLLGKHQVKNAALVIEAVKVLRSKGYIIDDKALKNGLYNAKWPGRIEIINKNPLFIIDGAHNAEGAEILRKTLEDYFHNKRKIFIIGVLRDKDYETIVKTVIPLADKVIAVTPNTVRAMPARELAIILKHYCNDVLINDTIEGAVNISLEISTLNDIICAFGSFYYIGEVRKIFK